LIKNIGWGAIIYIAAIAGVDIELLDAATIDGAGRFRRIWNVIIPSISGTIIIFFLLRISAILNSGFEQVWMLQNSLNIDMSETIDTYVYKIGIGNLNFSYATAVGLARSVIAVVLLVSANAFSRKFADKGLF
jgi:putative aldouronate transport system permease protein